MQYMGQNDRPVVIITGASKGIGAGLLAEYRKREWRVVGNALTMEASRDPGVVTVAGDIADPGTADEIMEAALQRYGRVDTLVNNAGIYISKPFTDYTADDYAKLVGVNLTGFFCMTQRAIPEMLKHGSGHVVNISATLADVAHSSTPAVLGALTKGGLAAATRSLAIEYASRGVRVNAVSPGVIETSMHPLGSYESEGHRMPPLGRLGRISDIVGAILFLESATYITGEVLHVDGGQVAGF